MNTFVGIFAKPIGWLLELLYDLIGSYGLAVVVFTVIVKLCLYPLYAKQIKSTANMASIQPKIQAIQRKYAHDQETMNAKIMELYKEENFNPMGGCLPMIIQMPIIFGIFALLRDPMAYISGTKMLMAIHESFLWMMDLSQPDQWILPIAAGITTFVSFTQTQAQQGAADPNNPSAGMTKMMKYLFPIMIVLMGRSFPSGLTIYWFLGQFIQIFFNLHLNKVRKKIREQNERKKK